MKPIFFTNETEETFLDRIRNNLRTCKAFWFSVSFIKRAGLGLLAAEMEAALQRGCRGKVITSAYQNFTDIESLNIFRGFMDQFSAFSCHFDLESFYGSDYAVRGYHSKGYLFEFPDRLELIVGSSNLTRYALLKNIEWDLCVSGNAQMDVFVQMRKEFVQKWDGTLELTTDVIKKYSNRLNYAVERWDMDYNVSEAQIRPNFMQRKAMKELNRYRAMGLHKALVVSAVGSGKTLLAAFDARNFAPERLLYLVHEGSILENALKTFQFVFGSQAVCELYSRRNLEQILECVEGGAHGETPYFLFAGNLAMANSLERFSRTAFDYVIVDECHHSTASTYRKILDYFEPEFLLGLTATPERMDNQDVFELFDTNVPYELRLRDAIINDLIVPFKYYGIRDQLVDYGLPKNEERRMIAQIASTEHAAFIHDEVERHRAAGKLKALVFCRNVTHARMMSEALGEYYYTAYLTGKNTVGERIRAYHDLQDEQANLEMLCTVDILNEGVDIPGVNMVLFLRPTESATIFIQQLGRGLRKYENKQFVTVLDFIGNSYRRSVQIAFALGSLAENLVLEKRLMLSLVNDDFSALGLEPYGVEIHIDPLSKEELTEYISSENFNSLNYMKQDYYNFKKYICSEYPPKHMDFWNNDCAPDLLKFMNIRIGGRKTNSYYGFLQGIEEENIPVFSERQREWIAYLSAMLPLVRAYEYQIVRRLCKGNVSYAGLKEELVREVRYFSEEELEHALRYMVQSKFIKQTGTEYLLDVELDDQLIEYMDDLLEYGLTRYEAEYPDAEVFQLWHTYRMDQVQLKLCKNPGYTMKGTYVYDRVVYIFAGLKKDANVEERINYLDRYLDASTFQWECEHDLSEAKQQELINSDHAVVFIRKVASENGMQMPFIYCGTGKMQLVSWPNNHQNTRNTLLFHINMKETLPDYLAYDFGVESTT